MKKTVGKVFVLLMVVAIMFVGWQILFKNGGVLKVAYNGIAGFVNGQFQKMTGTSDNLMKKWGGSEEVGAETDGNVDDLSGDAIE